MVGNHSRGRARIERTLRLNELTAITEDVVEAVRSALVMGVTEP